MLLENPSAYLVFVESTMSEIDFLSEVARRTGCGLLLDVNNVQVSAVNLGTDAIAYLDAFPVEHVGEIHLAGYAPEDDGKGQPLLIDAHDRPIDPYRLGALRAHHRPHRAGADADRMGQRRAGMAGAVRRSQARRRGSGRRRAEGEEPCARWLTFRRNSPPRCAIP